MKILLKILCILLILVMFYHVYNVYFNIYGLENTYPITNKQAILIKKVEHLSNTPIYKLLLTTTNINSVASITHTILGPVIRVNDDIASKMSDDEFMHILLHEIGHYKNNDGLIFIIVQILPFLFSLLIILIFFIPLSRIPLDKYFLRIIFSIGLYIIFLISLSDGMPILYAHYYNIEYKADRYSADVGSNIKLIDALSKLYLSEPTEISEKLSFLENIDYLTNYFLARQDINSHPSLENRVFALSQCRSIILH